ncbi:hypothetical protein BaRGS_00019046 [Batillaria attramentaria]|uniref:Uncharacterized protein n=1 Tax=Batillaria attramentaria TaxID=370345 RepID=A0ABD0KRP2_9CAEN
MKKKQQFSATSCTCCRHGVSPASATWPAPGRQGDSGTALTRPACNAPRPAAMLTRHNTPTDVHHLSGSNQSDVTFQFSQNEPDSIALTSERPTNQPVARMHSCSLTTPTCITTSPHFLKTSSFSSPYPHRLTSIERTLAEDKQDVPKTFAFGRKPSN